MLWGQFDPKDNRRVKVESVLNVLLGVLGLNVCAVLEQNVLLDQCSPWFILKFCMIILYVHHVIPVTVSLGVTYKPTGTQACGLDRSW